jgi:TetR/AcrR family transcriptional repressor of nem operon
MGKVSNREKILTEGLKVVHAHGYAGASVRDIVQAAGVPQGSFTNHFTSKEAFGLEILDMYLCAGRASMAETLRNDALPPLQRLAAYIDNSKNRLNKDGMRNGCLFGNFTAEATDHSEPIRQRLVEIFAEVQGSVAYCLKAAVAAGELPDDFKVEEVAGFIVSSLQGANLLAKAERSPAPVERFRQVLFNQVLR